MYYYFLSENILVPLILFKNLSNSVYEEKNKNKKEEVFQFLLVG